MNLIIRKNYNSMEIEYVGNNGSNTVEYYDKYMEDVYLLKRIDYLENNKLINSENAKEKKVLTFSNEIRRDKK